MKLIEAPEDFFRPITPQIDLLQFGLHDSGNAERILAEYGHDLLFCHEWKKWLHWDSQRWKIDTKAHVRHLAKRVMAKFLKQAIDTGNEAVEAFAKSSLNKKRIEYAMSLAEPESAIAPADLDANPWLLNFENATLDLRTGDVQGHRREDFITKLNPFDYDRDAKCPYWLNLLDRMMAGDQEMLDYLQIAFGYSLTGSTREKTLFVLFGPSGTGKTTMLTAFREALGPDYTALIQINSLVVGKENNTVNSDLSDLCGARFVMSSEPEQGQKLSPSKLKRITQGSGRIKTRRLYENVFDFEETHKLWIDANDRPQIPGADHATFARIHAIPCLVVIPREQMDRELVRRLREERPGILGWGVEGALRWQQDGLPRPAKVQAATDTWREQCDQLQMFILAHCVVGDGFTVYAEKFYVAYRNWCESAGEEAVTNTAFGLRMTQQFEKQHTKKGWLYSGIGLRTDTSEEPR